MEVAGAIARSMGGTTLEDLLMARGIDMPIYTLEILKLPRPDTWSGLARGIISPAVESAETVWNLLVRQPHLVLRAGRMVPGRG
jgi:hypothetical protein